MKIAILHHDIEPPEIKFQELFEKKRCFVKFHDIRKVSEEELLSYDFVFNRVYSSVASRDFNILFKTLSLLKNLENKGVKCINSYCASLADYNKYELYKFLSAEGIPTPPTIFVQNIKDIKKYANNAIKEFGFPLVIKRNCGGKSYEVTKVYSLKELTDTLKKMFAVAKNQGYKAGFIIQKFIKSIREHDCRVGIVENEFVFSYARSFISRNSKDKWIASTSGGSTEFLYNASEEEKKIAIKANQAINASFSESDIIMTKQGPCVIEVNLSPGYFIDSFEDIERMEIIVEKLIKEKYYEEPIKMKSKN